MKVLLTKLLVYAVEIACSVREEEVCNNETTLISVLLQFTLQPIEMIAEICCREVPTLHSEEEVVVGLTLTLHRTLEHKWQARILCPKFGFNTT